MAFSVAVFTVVFIVGGRATLVGTLAVEAQRSVSAAVEASNLVRNFFVTVPIRIDIHTVFRPDLSATVEHDSVLCVPRLRSGRQDSQ